MILEQDDTAQKASDFVFIGSRLWLDFVNTCIKQNGERVDFLSDFTELIKWLKEARVLDNEEAEESLYRWSSPSHRSEILGQARAFRTELKTAAEGITRAEKVFEDIVLAINSVLRSHFRTLELAFDGNRFVSRYFGKITEPLHILAPVAESAAQSLSGDDQTLTRKCDNPSCVLHFHDTTKNHTRRWCSMETCGNRIKAAAHYKRLTTKESE